MNKLSALAGILDEKAAKDWAWRYEHCQDFREAAAALREAEQVLRGIESDKWRISHESRKRIEELLREGG